MEMVSKIHVKVKNYRTITGTKKGKKIKYICNLDLVDERPAAVVYRFAML